MANLGNEYMIIGILQCGKVQEKLALKHGQYPTMFNTLLKQINPTFTYTTYDVESGMVPSNINACDAYIITGSHHGVYDDLPWIPSLQMFVRKLHAADKKIVGVCFGHQLVAQALGGKVIKSPKGWGVGISKSHIIQHKPWMIPKRDELNLIISHQDQVVDVPRGAEILAGNDFCPFYMTQMGNTLTIQGHPEFSKAYAEDVLEGRKAILDSTLFKEALQSLGLEKDDAIVARWIVNFINA